MNNDLSQFYQIFFDESLELIGNIEQILLNKDIENFDDETINTIFRCAHSIKGSSATFGFEGISHFTHSMENYLDLVRKGKKKLTKESVDLLLLCLDCIKVMIAQLQNKEELNLVSANELALKINELINSENEATQEAKSLPMQDAMQAIKNKESVITTTSPEVHAGWKIYFKPNNNIFKLGNDPLRIIRVLRDLGTVKSVVDLATIPSPEHYAVDSSYLAWNILIATDKTEAEIRNHAFEWVEDDSEITFAALNEADLTQENSKKLTCSVEKKEKKKSKTTATSPSVNEATSIRVSIEKIDTLINLVGELVITQAMLTQMINQSDGNKSQFIKEGIARLELNCRELQENVMQIRMLPISSAFNRIPRIVRDLMSQLNKKIEVIFSGENTELDKTVLEKIVDPLIHLVRNSVDHGIEMPDERAKQGKSATGTIRLNAFHESGNIIIQIIDDGAGLNREKILSKALANKLVGEHDNLTDSQIDDLIFVPGLSTAERVTDVSGRGVGMDVVRKNIEMLGGTVEVCSLPGKQTTFTIKLPLTLAILEGQLIQVSNQIYIFPLTSMRETIQIKKDCINYISKDSAVYHLRNEYIPIIKLSEIFTLKSLPINIEHQFLVIVDVGGQPHGIVIDKLLQQQQVVIKSLEKNYVQVDGVSGATILADGSVGLILDVVGIVKLSMKKENHLRSFSLQPGIKIQNEGVVA